MLHASRDKTSLDMGGQAHFSLRITCHEGTETE